MAFFIFFLHKNSQNAVEVLSIFPMKAMPTYGKIPTFNLLCFLWITLHMISQKPLPGKKEELVTLSTHS